MVSGGSASEALEEKGIGATRGAGFAEEDGGRQGLVPNGGGPESGHPLAEGQVPSPEGPLGGVLGFVTSRTKRKLRSSGEVRVWREAVPWEVVRSVVRIGQWASPRVAGGCPGGGRQVVPPLAGSPSSLWQAPRGVRPTSGASGSVVLQPGGWRRAGSPHRQLRPGEGAAGPGRGLPVAHPAAAPAWPS